MPGAIDWWIFIWLSSFKERVKEASSSEVPQKKGPVRIYSDSLEKPRSESLATHQRKCLRALQTRAQKETRLVVKVCNLCRVKTDISAVLTVKSGLDPHMIIELEDDSKLMFLLMVTYDISYILFCGLMV